MDLERRASRTPGVERRVGRTSSVASAHAGRVRRAVVQRGLAAPPPPPSSTCPHLRYPPGMPRLPRRSLGGLLLLAACTGAPGHPSTPDPTVTETETPTCATGAVWDGVACVPEACGPTRWGVSDTADVYVDAAAAPGGDGSAAAPFPTLAEAVAVGGVVAITSGTYPEALTLDDTHDGLVLRGRCPELVTVDGQGATEGSPVISLSGARRTSIGLEGLTLTGGPAGGIHVLGGALSGARLVVRANSQAGIVAWGSTASADLADIVVTEVDAPRGGTSDAFEVGDGAALTLRRATVDGAERELILALDAGTTLTLEDVSFGARSGDRGAAAVELQDGVQASFTRVQFHDQVNAAVVAIGAGTEMSAADLEVTDTHAGDADVGVGVKAQERARITVDGGSFSGNAGLDAVAVDAGELVLDGTTHQGPGVAVQAQDGGIAEATELVGEDAEGNGAAAVAGTLTLTDVTLRRTTDPDETVGAGVFASEGGTVDAIGLVVEEVAGTGVTAESGAWIGLTDSTISGTTVDADTGAGGFALRAWEGGVLEATRVDVGEATRIAAVSYGAGSQLLLHTVTLTDTRFDPDGAQAAGAVAMSGGALEATDLVVDGAGTHGLYVDGADSWLDLTRVQVSGVLPDRDGAFGRGIDVYGPARFTDVEVEDTQEAGVIVSGEAGVLEANGLTVRGVAAGTVQTTAVGLAVERGARLEGEDVEVAEVAGPGLYVAEADAACTGCTFHDDGFAGVLVLSGGLDLLDTEIRDTGEDAAAGGGVGVWAGSADDSTSTNRVTLDGLSVSGHTYASLWLAAPGSYRVTGSDLAGSAGVDGAGLLHGNAVYATGGIGAWDGATGLSLTDSVIHDAVGVGVLLDGASATLSGDTWTDNGVDLVQQGCAGVAAVDGIEAVPQTDVCPATDRLVADLSYSITLEDVAVGVE